MNPLTLKFCIFDVERKGFYSASHTDFVWPRGIVQSQCDHCNPETIERNCTCGIWSSPNPEILKYYDKRNGVLVLLNTYGRNIFMDGTQYNFPHMWVMRSWATQIIGIVDPGSLKNDTALRQLSAIHGSAFYETKLYPWNMAKAMIKASWIYNPEVQLNPYQEA